MYDDNAIILERVGGAHVRRESPDSSESLDQSIDNLSKAFGTLSKALGTKVSKRHTLDDIPTLYETLCRRLQDEFSGMEMNDKPKTFDKFVLASSQKCFCRMMIRQAKDTVVSD